MREPRADGKLFGVLAEFDRPEDLLDAAGQARAAGFRQLDAYSPYPIDGLAEMLGFHEDLVPWITFAGGVLGAVIGFGMQVYANLDYPLDVGGRPLISTSAFLLVTFQIMVIFAVFAAIGSMLVLNRLPRLHHPVFGIDRFQLATSSKFFLIVFSNDRQFDQEETARFLETLNPVSVQSVAHTEEPE